MALYKMHENINENSITTSFDKHDDISVQSRRIEICTTLKGGGIRMVVFKSNELVVYGDDEEYLLTQSAGLNQARKNGLLKETTSDAEKKFLALLRDVTITVNPFTPMGWDDKTKDIYNNIPKPRFDVEKGKANSKIPKLDKLSIQALSIFDADIKWKAIPFSLIIIAYQIFHHRYIMPTLAMVGAQGDGKSFYTYELPRWYLGPSMVGLISPSLVEAGWGDESLYKRILAYNDVSNMNKGQEKAFRDTIKNEATEGESQTRNLKGGKLMKARYGSNRNITSNSNIPLETDGGTDRRIYVSAYDATNIDANVMAREYGREIGALTDNQHANRSRLVQHFYNIYEFCEANKDEELEGWLTIKVPDTVLKQELTSEKLPDGRAMMNDLIGAPDTDLIDIFERYCTNPKAIAERYVKKRIDDGKGSWFLNEKLLVHMREAMRREGYAQMVTKAQAARALFKPTARSFNQLNLSNGKRARGLKVKKKA